MDAHSKERALTVLREVFFFVPSLLKRGGGGGASSARHHSRYRAVTHLTAWTCGVVSLLLQFVARSSAYAWLCLCAMQIFFVIAGSICIYHFVEYREKSSEAMSVAVAVNPLLEIALGIRALQMFQGMALGAVWTSMLFILPGVFFDLFRRRHGTYYVDVTTLWKTLGQLDDACKVRLAVDSVLFVWLLALFFIQLLQMMLT